MLCGWVDLCMHRPNGVCVSHLATGFGNVFALLVACLCLLSSQGADRDAIPQPVARRRVRLSKGDADEAPVQAGPAL